MTGRTVDTEEREPETAGAGSTARTTAVEDTAHQTDAGEPSPARAPHRPGRGGFDPEADSIARAARYRDRQRAVAGMAAGAVLTALLALLFTSAFWWGTVAFIAALALYLVYLRRQVQLEQQIRRRRMARLQRARERDRAEERAQHTVPTAPRRESVQVLDLDDEDPAFEHLEHYDGAAHSAPERGDGPLPTASGQ